MKINKFTSLVLSLTAIAASSCTVKEQIDETINSSEFNAGEYVRLSLTGGNGTKGMPSGATRAIWEDPNGQNSLIFKWEQVDISAQETDRLTLVVSNGTEAISSHASAEPGESDADFAYSTGLAVTPNEADSHYAKF